MYLYFLYLEKNKKRYLFFTFLLLLWATLMLTRFLIIVSLLQLAAIYISTKGINLKKIIIFLVFIFISIILFGLAGDFRTGEKTFYALAQPNQSWPFFLPSGFLWVYMYVTTPFNNLVNTYTYLPASYSYGAQTFGSLIPSFIRKDFITYNSSGKLVTKAFNVSTAYVEPLLDFHIIGVFMYSFLISFTAYFYYRRLIISNRSLFTYAVFYQAIILCIFFNEILYLPVLFQFFLIYITNKIYKFEKRVKL
jgi:oligosaccharide repeat unit polymerase